MFSTYYSIAKSLALCVTYISFVLMRLMTFLILKYDIFNKVIVLICLTNLLLHYLAIFEMMIQLELNKKEKKKITKI